MKRHSSGFTLIELLVVIAIVAILAAILFPVFAKARATAQQASCASNMAEVAKACLMYSDVNSGKLPPFDYNNGNPSTQKTRVMWYMMIQPFVKSNRILCCPGLKFNKKAEAEFYDDPGTGVSPTYTRIMGMGTNSPHVFWGNNSVNEAPPGFLVSSARNGSRVMMLCDAYLIENKVEVGFPCVSCKLCHTSGTTSSPSGGINYDTKYGNISDRHSGNTNIAFLDAHVKCPPRSKLIPASDQADVPTDLDHASPEWRDAAQMWGHPPYL